MFGAKFLTMVICAFVCAGVSRAQGHEELHVCEGGFGIGAERPAGFSAAASSPIPKPAVVSRTEWGCPEGQGSNWSPQYTTVTHLVVHHSAGSNTSADWAGTVRGIWSFHSRPVSEGGRGWGDIGYNYLIDPEGVIYEGRAGGDNVIAAHFSCRNGGTMGVCLIGNYQSTSPTAAALDSLKRLLAWKAAQRELNVEETALHTGTGLVLTRVCGHRDANGSYPEEACSTTTCPGDRLYGLLSGVRDDVQAMVGGWVSRPVVAALGASEVTAKEATLWGRVEAEGPSPVLERRFEWGADGTFTRWTTGVTISGDRVTTRVGNLELDTEYQVRFSVRDSEGWTTSAPVAFRTRTQLGIQMLDGANGELKIRGQPGTMISVEGSVDLDGWAVLLNAQIPGMGVLRLNPGSTHESRFFRAVVTE